MFDYVPRKDLDAERERRIRAEAAAEIATGQIIDLREEIAQLMSLLEKERQRHQEAMTDAFDRILPKPRDPVPGFGVPGEMGHLTYEQIMNSPAVGKRGMMERNRAALEAKLREETEGKEATNGKQRAVLSAEEAALLDHQIPK